MNVVKGIAYVAATAVTLGVVATAVVIVGAMTLVHLNSRMFSFKR